MTVPDQYSNQPSPSAPATAPPKQKFPVWAWALIAVLGVIISLTFTAVVIWFLYSTTSDRGDGSSLITTPLVIESSEEARVDGERVENRCFSFNLPSGYGLVQSSGCNTNINIPKGDSLTAIHIMPALSGGAKNVKEIASCYNDPSFSAEAVEVIEIAGTGVVEVSVKDSNGLKVKTYLMPVKEVSKRPIVVGGKNAEVIQIMGYAYNSHLDNNLRTIVADIVR